MSEEGRFSEALAGTSRRVENQALWYSHSAIVLPTVGMIVPNWFIVVPTTHSLNFAAQPDASRDEIPGLLQSIRNEAGHHDDEMIVFEHGPATAGSAVGCGVDHAHLHVIIAPRSLALSVWDELRLDLGGRSEPAEINDLHRAIDKDQPYYFAWMGGKRLVEQPIKHSTSQRLRRAVARAAGCPEDWDYRSSPFFSNITRTVDSLRAKRLKAA